MGVLLICDLLVRSTNLSFYYTDWGAVPRTLVIDNFSSPWTWSLHLMSGGAVFQAGLFLLAGVFAILLIVGWRTRLVTIACWVLLFSLHKRNPLVLDFSN